MSVTLSIPGDPVATLTPVAGAGVIRSDGLNERVRTYGTSWPDQIRDYGEGDYTLIAATPQTIDLSAINALNGSSLTSVAGKCVYLRILQLSGVDDVTVKKAAANPIDLWTGTTDEQRMNGGCLPLVDVLPPTSVLVPSAPLFDATHKNIVVTSVTGARIRIKIGVV